ncbi:hypothetical protein LF887_14435 [Chryseobacterium sp. MEBOG06]|uniref:hypothetical protein n=1 Tax=Chryseobacterium sp. MEBOG06 TaxID=2879938 RepID=UPI001F470FE7|nr:hypothetical protein [Chryseobacterium sp. MEBOG06]UKB82203.1 hypothetical protein LF887_14435 [Chryseobacterium sp. MEBOG06]
MKVFVNKRIPEIGIEMLKKAGLQVILPENENLSYEEWIEYCKNTDTILSVGGDFKYDKNFLMLAPILKLLLYIP